MLVSDIQSLVGSIRTGAGIRDLTAQIGSINAIVGEVITRTRASGHGGLASGLDASLQRLLEAGDNGREMAQRGIQPGDREWQMWSQILPPIAFEIARETKELVQQVGQMAAGAEDFS